MTLIKGQQITKVSPSTALAPNSLFEALCSYATQQIRFKNFTIQRDCFVSSTFASLVNILQQRFGFPAENRKKNSLRDDENAMSEA